MSRRKFIWLSLLLLLALLTILAIGALTFITRGGITYFHLVNLDNSEISGTIRLRDIDPVDRRFTLAPNSEKTLRILHIDRGTVSIIIGDETYQLLSQYDVDYHINFKDGRPHLDGFDVIDFEMLNMDSISTTNSE